MAEGFIQVAPDGTGKQLDNDVVQVPAGTVITDGSGNQTTLAAPQYYFRERVVAADPNDPRGVATVATGLLGPSGQDYGLTVRLPAGQPDFMALYGVLADIDTVLNAMVGQGFMGATSAPQANAQPRLGILGPALPSPSVPVAMASDYWGRQIVAAAGTRETQQSYETTITAATETALFSNPDPLVYYDLLAIVISNTSTTAVRVDIRDQLSTVTGPASKNGVLPIYVPAGDMRGISLGGVMAYQSNAGQQWTATVASAVTDIRVWALFAQNRSK